MKRKLLIFPLLFSFGLFFVLPFIPVKRAFAEDFSEDGYLYLHRSGALYYFSLFYDDSNGKQNTLYCDGYDDPSTMFTVSENNGSYWISLDASTSISFTNGKYQNAHSYSDVSFTSNFLTFIHDIEIDSSGVVNFYKYQAGVSGLHESTPCFSLSVDEHNVHGIYTNIFEFAGFVENTFNLNVSFSPALSGDVDRSVTVSTPRLGLEADANAPAGFYDDRTIVSDSFTMYVENTGNQSGQYFFAIVPEGEHIEFATPYSSEYDIIGCTYNYNTPVYVWWSQHWNYSYTATVYSDDAPLAPVNDRMSIPAIQQYSASPWHSIAAGESLSQTFKWDEMNLVKGRSYDVYVYGIATDLDTDSRQCVFPDDDYYVPLTESECFYSSTFRATNPMPFNNQSQNGHVIWNNPAGYVDSAWSSTAYKDENGVVQIQQKDISDYNKTRSDLTGQAWDVIHDNYNSLVQSNRENANFSNLLSTSKSFFSFVSSVFGFFPSYVSVSYSLGFWTLVFLAVIRRLH